jgi:hypothetical protein
MITKNTVNTIQPIISINCDHATCKLAKAIKLHQLAICMGAFLLVEPHVKDIVGLHGYTSFYLT